jgi:hypothetical protein
MHSVRTRGTPVLIVLAYYVLKSAHCGSCGKPLRFRNDGTFKVVQFTGAGWCEAVFGRPTNARMRKRSSALIEAHVIQRLSSSIVPLNMCMFLWNSAPTYTVSSRPAWCDNHAPTLHQQYLLQILAMPLLLL